LASLETGLARWPGKEVQLMASKRTRLVAAGMVAVALLAVSASGTFARSVERPFVIDQAGYTTGIVYSPSFPDGDTFGGRCSQPSQWVSSSAGTGHDTHLGRVTWASEHCFQLSAGTFSDARVVITAANGDQLHATYEGVMTGETTFTDSVVITGGTGRFAGATGSVDETGWFDPETGYMEVGGVGTISYDASQRASG
jgi:hypothetical protein